MRQYVIVNPESLDDIVQLIIKTDAEYYEIESAFEQAINNQETYPYDSIVELLKESGYEVEIVPIGKEISLMW